MKTHALNLLCPALLLCSIWPPSPACAQDNVTVPKARLEELERKERELERLKGAGATQPGQSVAPAPTSGQAATNAGAAPVVTRNSPPMASLPPLKPDEVVEAVDLANYYHADSAAADQRYRGQKLTIRGEVIGFEKPLFIRNYRIILQGGDRETKVICDFFPPEKFNAVFAAKHGSELVGLSGEQRVTLSKVGELVLVKGLCKGWKESAVMISAGQIEPAK